MSAVPVSALVWRLSFERKDQIKVALVGAAFIAVFWNLLDFIPPGLGGLSYAWVHDQDWSHGPIIPLFSAYLVYLRWDKLKGTPVRYAWVGLILLIGALLLYQASLALISFGYVRPLAMLLCLLGVIVFLCGLPALRHLWLPWLYLFFAIPLPKGIYFQLTDPLRRLAARVSSVILGVVPGLTIQRRGSIIEYIYNGAYGAIGVADACSGMRSTMTLCALGVAVTFMSGRAWWQRLIMIGACVPIAVFCNVIRVTITCALYIFVDPKYAAGTYHMTLGLIMLMIAFGIFSALGWVLSNLVIEEPETASPRS